MPIKKNKPFWIAGLGVSLLFLTLFMIRLDVFEWLFSRPETFTISATDSVKSRESWMNIFQKKNKIGFSHTLLSETEAGAGYRIQETVFMRINTMGIIQDINIKTTGKLKRDMSLQEIDFEMQSGRFHFAVRGSVKNDILTVRTRGAGDERRFEVKLDKKPYLVAGIIDAVAATELKSGDKYKFDIFDPATMGQAPVQVEVVGREEVEIMGEKQMATKVTLGFKGATQAAWIGDNGDLLQEKGLLGIRMEKTTRKDALSDLSLEPSGDLTLSASIESNVRLNAPQKLNVLKVKISGTALNSAQLNGDRQSYQNGILTIRKENLSNLPSQVDTDVLTPLERIFLKPDPFIQSDNEKIQELSRTIISSRPGADSLQQARLLMEWVHRNIEKRPVLSMPNALSTLENRVGDCNEHAMLMAALARAAGIPARVEAGVVYLKGRFYYHAWNLLYLGRWITVDSLFGQLPADVTHIRFVTGSQQQQLDLIGIIGKVQLEVLE